MCGRWKAIVAGVIATCVEHVPSGIANVIAGITTYNGLFYFILDSEVLSRVSSHMLGSWYLSMFLFRYGLLTLIYMTSFMVLMKFWSSLSTMLEFSTVVI